MIYRMSLYNNITTRPEVVNGLAVVGFITLIALGISLAVYSSRFVPNTVGGLGAAAVSLSQIFTSAEPTLTVVPAAQPLLPFSEMSSTTDMQSASAPADTTPNKPATSTTAPQPNWTPNNPVVATNGTNSSPAPATYHGLPDLSVQIETVGYTVADGSIVSPTSIPAYKQGAVKFRVTNVGTNVSGQWTVSISVAGNTYTQVVDSLVPTEPRGFIAYFINVQPGADRTVIITIDPNHQLAESSTANNTATTSVTVLSF